MSCKSQARRLTYIAITAFPRPPARCVPGRLSKGPPPQATAQGRQASAQFANRQAKKQSRPSSEGCFGGGSYKHLKIRFSQ